MTTESVILLHGILRRARSMRSLARRLEKEGYRTLCHDYPSRTGPIEAHAARLAPLASAWAAEGKLHFIGHSMGGLVIRQLLHDFPEIPVSRVVMLGTPNQGSEVADFLQHWRPYQWLYGPSGQQLTTRYARGHLTHATHTEIGVIAGSRSYDPFCSLLLGHESDGKVAVERTKLATMRDHCVIPVGHSLMPDHKEVQQATLTFLQTGHFL